MKNCVELDYIVIINSQRRVKSLLYIWIIHSCIYLFKEGGDIQTGVFILSNYG